MDTAPTPVCMEYLFDRVLWLNRPDRLPGLRPSNLTLSRSGLATIEVASTSQVRYYISRIFCHDAMLDQSPKLLPTFQYYTYLPCLSTEQTRWRGSSNAPVHHHHHARYEAMRVKQRVLISPSFRQRITWKYLSLVQSHHIQKAIGSPMSFWLAPTILSFASTHV
jgi:hypothetical protein